ncbi:hypothetical protein M569_12931, partial [Genlisea aurea]
MEKKGVSGSILMRKYEIGKLLGQGSFAKVHHARNLESGQSVAVKIIDKDRIMKVGLIDQIKREISTMRLVRHPNVVELHEVMATRAKIYFVMEYVRGGELFNRVAQGRLREDAARRYFQQLIAAVDFCHSRGVYHRDLKPENLLLDEFGNLKVSDFGLSALVDSKAQDGLLHTTCGTPAYVAPEVIHRKGYDGEKADVWSCGVILFVLLAGYLPFQDSNLMELYRKIRKGEFRCPHWFPPEVRKLLSKILNPNPSARITISRIMENSWFQKGFRQTENLEESPRCVFDAIDEAAPPPPPHPPPPPPPPVQPHRFNAFDLLSLSPGFNLSGLFEKDAGTPRSANSWFTTQMPPALVVEKLEELAVTECFQINKKDGVVKMHGWRGGRKGKLAIETEIFEVTPSFHMVEVKKTSGDTMEYLKFCDQGLRPSLKDVAWSWQG